MPTIDQALVTPLFDYAKQIASGLGQSLNTGHILLAIIESAQAELKNILERYEITANRLMPFFNNQSEHHALIDRVKTTALRACQLSYNPQEQPIHLLIGILAVQECRAFQILQQSMRINNQGLQTELLRLVGISVKNSNLSGNADSAPNYQAAATQALDPKSALAACSRDLTELASQGKLDPVIGRESEIARALEILCKKNKNNPVFIGEAGVGKTAIVEGIALKLAMDSNIPNKLKGKRLLELNLTSLVSGTQFRGQFESRIKSILDEIIKHPELIVFIDEIHNLIGTGSAEGSMDAANILKPALARGEIRCIGATTLDEYRKIENDAALERRFQPITVDPPSEQDTLAILNGLKIRYEEFHKVVYAAEALEAAVKLSVRYIHDRNLPDKAIDLIDQAGSRKSLNEQSSSPSLVTETDIALIVREWTGVPVISSNEERERMLRLKDDLQKQVIGQNQAIEAVASSLLGLRDTSKPISSFIFLGPTGVGKTVLAKELAGHIFGTTEALIMVNMSEYQEKHTVARLIGAPPGYVGYEEGGQLTEKVRRKPFSVILFDEIEKAHPDIFDILLQVLNDGVLVDGQGKKVFFNNTLIIMTSNIQVKRQKSVGFGDQNETMEQADLALQERGFKVEFINRIDAIIQFKSLNLDAMRQILELELKKALDLAAEQGLSLNFSEPVKEFLVQKGFNQKYGARNLQRTIKKYILDPLGLFVKKEEFKTGDNLEITLLNAQLLFSKISPPTQTSN